MRDNALLGATLTRIESDAEARQQAIGDNRVLDKVTIDGEPAEELARKARRARAFLPLRGTPEGAILRAMPLDRMDRALMFEEMLGHDAQRAAAAALRERTPGERP
jgi:hypothetical protein